MQTDGPTLQKQSNTGGAPGAEYSVNALILDDSNFDRKRLRRIAKHTGVPIEFTSCASLIAFKKLLDEQEFHIIFIDYRLPEGNGLEALKMLEKHPTNASASAIMIAGDLDADIVASAFKNGCVDYIAKQKVDKRQLRHTILNALNLVKTRQDKATF
ncbi:response regulator [Roseobacter sp. N2S]|uniref:response regulator n=1 Tax=Roseobacter sp. N2S TaxID=2663844 RepID=UPI00286464DB|nr:response regulator [Roseobacter sp. N2S]MDR6265406.1 PleD family two-component response regulator [Roseobacter sp. N2S]